MPSFCATCGGRRRSSITATLTLALGVGANTAIFSVINGFMRPLPVPHPEQIVVLATTMAGDETGLRFRFSFPAVQDYRARAPGVLGRLRVRRPHRRARWRGRQDHAVRPSGSHRKLFSGAGPDACSRATVHGGRRRTPRRRPVCRARLQLLAEAVRWTGVRDRHLREDRRIAGADHRRGAEGIQRHERRRGDGRLRSAVAVAPPRSPQRGPVHEPDGPPVHYGRAHDAGRLSGGGAGRGHGTGGAAGHRIPGGRKGHRGSRDSRAPRASAAMADVVEPAAARPGTSCLCCRSWCCSSRA